MIYLAYTLYDSKAGFYAPPFFVAHRGQAIRAVMDLAQDNKNNVGRYPADFELYEIGTYDDTIGLLNPLAAPLALGRALSFLPVQDTFKLEPTK